MAATPCAGLPSVTRHVTLAARAVTPASVPLDEGKFASWLSSKLACEAGKQAKSPRNVRACAQVAFLSRDPL